MPTVHLSAFAVAAFWGVSDVYKCPQCLQLALVAVNEKPPGCNSPHDCLVMLSIDLATFCAIYSTIMPIWKCEYLMCVYPATAVAPPRPTTPIKSLVVLLKNYLKWRAIQLASHSTVDHRIILYNYRFLENCVQIA